jgi:microcystin-dependent protein
LFADGAAVSRAAYAALFFTISTVFGVGDNLTTFNLPDLRGYFIRGTGTNVDGTVSAAFGTKQADAFKSHTHTVPIEAGGPGGMSMVPAGGGSTIASGGTGSTETRPKNIALQTIIKF